MQLVLSNNRIVAHGENFLSMGGVVINTETGAKYENATIAECDGCPADIDKVGYEYRAGVFVPCAPFGVGNNNGYFMEVCESCATPRSSGIPIRKGLGVNNVNFIQLIWENESPSADFTEQDIGVTRTEYVSYIVTFNEGESITIYNNDTDKKTVNYKNGTKNYFRNVQLKDTAVYISNGYRKISSSEADRADDILIPFKIYGVKL